MRENDYAGILQEQTIKEVETNKPKYIVWVNVWVSWLKKPNSKKRIWQWMKDYLNINYKIVGVVDILPSGTEYYFDEKAIRYKPRSKFYILILKKVVS
jgi:hypothetical protein